MSYPAYDAFARDPGVTFARWRVYQALQPPVLSHAVERPVKLEWLSHSARVRKSAAARALAWLIQEGYLVVHARDRRRMPSLTLAYAVADRSQVPAVDRSA